MVARNECIRICDAVNAVGDWFYNWQTLISGLLALGAAIWAGSLLRKQISQLERHERDRLDRRHQAQRFMMSHSLSTSSRYAKEVVIALSVARGVVKGGQRLSQGWTPPIFPTEVVQNLCDFMESSDRNDVNALVGELISQLQILGARLDSLVEDDGIFRIGIPRNIADYQLQAAKIRQICSALFPYCRKETEEVPIELDRVSVVSSLNFMEAGDDDAAFAEMISSFESRENPWWPKQ